MSVECSWMELVHLEEETWRGDLSLSLLHVRTHQEGSCLRGRKRLCPKSDHAATLLLDFWPPRIMRKKFLSMTLLMPWVNEGDKGQDLHQHRVLGLEPLPRADMAIRWQRDLGDRKTFPSCQLIKTLSNWCLRYVFTYSRYVSRATRISTIVTYTFLHKYNWKISVTLNKNNSWLTHWTIFTLAVIDPKAVLQIAFLFL